ncbi:MAG: MBL fold metallo-hydrolase [Deltaproteobacteria bacterium]|nr:MBL fold metallo-hydrolase [Deltaproteobacteria bacterium]
MTATITVLVDNRTGNDDLAFEHGLSLWIESEGVHVLFDTGQSDAFADNARRLGVPLERADHIVLSHGHYDHGGGLATALATAPQATVHLHAEALRTRFSIRDAPRSIGLPAPALRALETNRARIRWTSGPTPLAPGLGLSGPIPRLTDFEDTGGPFFLDPEGRTPDDLVDDQALWIDTPRGIVAVLGCGHSGLVNTVRYLLAQVPDRRLHAVLGGLHLNAASEHRLDATIAALAEWRPDCLAPGHCTGERASGLLREAFPEAWRPVHSGAQLRVG